MSGRRNVGGFLHRAVAIGGMRPPAVLVCGANLTETSIAASSGTGQVTCRDSLTNVWSMGNGRIADDRRNEVNRDDERIGMKGKPQNALRRSRIRRDGRLGLA